MSRALTRAALLAVGVVAMSATPALAANLVVAPRKSTFGCAAQEQFNTISAAVAAAHPGDQITVCPGTYQETVLINKSDLTLQSQQPLLATIKAPHAPVVAVVQITGSNDTLEGFTITNSGQESSPNSIQYGVYISNGGSADLERNDISDISDAPISGDQNGVAVEAGLSTVPTSGSVILTQNTIQEYQKNGVTVDGSGSYGDIEQNTITGVGPTDVTAQNGIQISSGASGVIKNNIVNNNVYSPGTTSSTGILLCGAAFTDTDGNSLSTDDTGIYDAANEPTELCPPAPKSRATINDNSIADSTFDGLVLDTENGAQVQGDQAAGTWGHTYGPDQGDGFDVYNTTNSQLSDSTAAGNSEDGFHNESNSTGNAYIGNEAPANLVFDCEDDTGGPPTNTWRQDLGDINLPAFICRPGSQWYATSAASPTAAGAQAKAGVQAKAGAQAKAAPKRPSPSK